MNIHRNNDYIQLYGRERTTLTCLCVFIDIKNNNWKIDCHFTIKSIETSTVRSRVGTTKR